MVQEAGNIFEVISPNLNPDGGVRRTQKQKALKQFVIVSSRLKPFVFQIHFKHLAVAYICEYRNIDSGLYFSRRDHNSIIPAFPWKSDRYSLVNFLMTAQKRSEPAHPRRLVLGQILASHL